MRRLLLLYLVTAALFLVLDMIWIGGFMKPFFESRMPGMMASEIRLVPAVLFYLAYVAGTVYFASARALGGPKALGAVARDAAVLGFLAYGTYGATTYAVIEGWSGAVALADLVWGTVATPLVAVGGLVATRRLVGSE